VIRLCSKFTIMPQGGKPYLKGSWS